MRSTGCIGTSDDTEFQQRKGSSYGYGIAALGLGIAAHFSGSVEAAFRFAAISMFLSGAVLWLFGAETHPLINPDTSGERA